MEEKIKSRMTKWLKKDNLLILLLAGVLLVVIALPTEKNGGGGQDTGQSRENTGGAAQDVSSSVTGFSDTEEYAAYLERRLENTLSQVSGVGEVQVMITLEATRELVLEKDREVQSNSTANCR